MRNSIAFSLSLLICCTSLVLSLPVQNDESTYQKEKQQLISSPAGNKLSEFAIEAADAALAKKGGKVAEAARWMLPDPKLLEDKNVVRWLRTPKFSHDAAATAVVYLNEETLATSSLDGTVRLWDIRNGNLLNQWKGKDGKPITCMVKSNDRTMLAIGQGAPVTREVRLIRPMADDYEVSIWNWKEAKALATTSINCGGTTALAFSPDGKRLVMGLAAKSALVWDWATNKSEELTSSRDTSAASWSKQGQLITSFRDTTNFWGEGFNVAKPVRTPLWLHAIAFTPDGKKVTTAGDEQDAVQFEKKLIRTFDVEKTVPIKSFAGQTGRIYFMKYLKDGKTLVTASAKPDMQIRFWNAETGESIRQIPGHTDDVLGFDINEAETQLASVSADGTIRLTTLEKLDSQGVVFQGHQEAVWSFTVSSDGKTALSGGIDKTIRFWNTQTGKEEKQLPQTSPVLAVAWKPGSNVAAFATADLTIHLLDTTTRQVTKTIPQAHKETLTTLLFASQSNKFYSTGADRIIHEWDIGSGKVLRSFTGHSGVVLSLSLSLDEKTLASGAGDNSIKIWNAEDGTLLTTLIAHSAPVHAVNFSPGGKFLVSAGGDGQVFLWNSSDPKTTRKERPITGRHGHVMSAVFAPDSRYLALGGSDGVVHLWDIQSLSETNKLTGHSQWISQIAFSKEGDAVYSCGLDGTLRKWELQKKDEKGYGQSTRMPDGVQLSNDGKLVALYSNNGPLQVMETATGKVLFRLETQGAMFRTFLFSPDNQALIALSNNSNLHVWKLPSGEALSPQQTGLGIDSWQWYKKDGESFLMMVAGSFNQQLEVIRRSMNDQYVLGGPGSQTRTYINAGQPNDWAKSTPTLFASNRRAGVDSFVQIASGKNSPTATFDNEGVQIARLMASSDGTGLLGHYPSSSISGLNIFLFWKNGEKKPTSRWQIKATVKQFGLFADGKSAFVIDSNGELTYWNTEKGEEVKKFEVGKGVMKAYGLPGGELVLVYQNGGVVVWKGI